MSRINATLWLIPHMSKRMALERSSKSQGKSIAEQNTTIGALRVNVCNGPSHRIDNKGAKRLNDIHFYNDITKIRLGTLIWINLNHV